MQQSQNYTLKEIARRNKAIADIAGFKKYIPNRSTLDYYKEKYDEPKVNFYFIPDVGKYSVFELKFNSCYNWLLSAICEVVKKYRYNHSVDKSLEYYYRRIENINTYTLGKEHLWLDLSNFCLRIQELKMNESSTEHNN